MTLTTATIPPAVILPVENGPDTGNTTARPQPAIAATAATADGARAPLTIIRDRLHAAGADGAVASRLLSTRLLLRHLGCVMSLGRGRVPRAQEWPRLLSVPLSSGPRRTMGETTDTT